MPKADTVAVPSLSREQAIAAADWLEKDYQPGTVRDVAAAQELAQKLYKAARRKRQDSSLNLQVPRLLAQWFGAFTEPTGSWFFRTDKDRGKDVYLPAQSAPEPIQAIASLFMKAASRRRGRPPLSLPELKDESRLSCSLGRFDERWPRRVRKRLEHWLWAMGKPSN